MESPETPVWLRRIFGLLLIVLLGIALIAWEVHGIKSAVEQMEEEMPSQSTEVPIAVQGTNTTTTVTTTFREAPHTTETDEQWDARHIATCARIKAAWEALE